jgi:pyruvate oxidase
MSGWQWVGVETDGLEVGRVTTVVAGGRALCLAKTAEGYGCLDNRCPHQGGPLGDGQIADGYLICPWHAYEYDPLSGKPPPGFKDAAVAYAVEEREDGVWVELPVHEERTSLMDQMVDVLCDWGLDTVFGMVGHSNLGLADALRKAEADGRLTYVGIRHEGAAAFAASGYAKVSGRLAARLATKWSQTVLTPDNATELAALAMKHAIVERDVAHLIVPDEVQELPGLDQPPDRPMAGRVASVEIAPPSAELVTTAVRHAMPITRVLVNNSELGKISKEQIGALRPVWQTHLVNPDFAAFAELCGGRGFRVEHPDQVQAALSEALAVTDGPSLVELITSARDV